MDQYSGGADAPDSAFVFHGRWTDFLPIALTNVLLTIVTLGIYRFWAKTRERKYLWSQTQFIDERLEWAGTGKEMFIGFLVVMVIFFPLIALLNFGLQALTLRGEILLGGLLVVGVYLALLYLGGVALFRALRYRLSRTYWHGIRGGSDNPGWRYGGEYLWRTIAGIAALGLLVPWSMVTLWRQRWREMSFGPHRFEIEEGRITSLIGVYLVALLTPVVAAIFVALAAPAALYAGVGYNLAFIGFIGIVAYIVFLFASLSYYADYFRLAISELRLSTLSFEFNATAGDWLKLILGHIGLVIVTLGIGALFISYRNWSFFVRHMEATGEISLSRLTQSTTSLATDAEGLADAFDVGAI
jgi:uncharacterized membrane protein YjgN (DUF898 family)